MKSTAFLPALAAVGAGAAALLCCAGPLVLGALGIGFGTLGALRAGLPAIAGALVIVLALGVAAVRRRPRTCGTQGTSAAPRRAGRSGD